MIIGVDIGGTKVLAGAFDEAGEIVQLEKFPTPRDYRELVDKCVKTINKLSSNSKVEVCLGIPNDVDPESSQLIIRKLGWTEAKPFPGDIESGLADGSRVVFRNDAKLAGLFQARKGAAKNTHRALYLTISTGIGGAVTSDGSLDQAFEHLEPGATKYWREGAVMKWEDFASGNSFQLQNGTIGKETSSESAWKEYAEALSIGFYNLIRVINPDIIVVGGGMGSNLDKFKTFLNEEIRKLAQDTSASIPDIVLAVEPENSSLLGCYENLTK